MIGPILRAFIVFIAHYRNYQTHSIVVNEVEETGTAHISVDSKHMTFIYNTHLKKWVEKTPADELLHAVNKK